MGSSERKEEEEEKEAERKKEAQGEGGVQLWYDGGRKAGRINIVARRNTPKHTGTLSY